MSHFRINPQRGPRTVVSAALALLTASIAVLSGVLTHLLFVLTSDGPHDELSPLKVAVSALAAAVLGSGLYQVLLNRTGYASTILAVLILVAVVAVTAWAVAQDFGIAVVAEMAAVALVIGTTIVSLLIGVVSTAPAGSDRSVRTEPRHRRQDRPRALAELIEDEPAEGEAR